jgi:hypothetical protein
MRPSRLAWLLSLPLSYPAAAAATDHARLDDWTLNFSVRPDLTYTETFSQDWTLLTDRGVAANNKDAVTFYPKSQRLELLDAWVKEPDGTVIKVRPDGVFTRPSQAAQNAPGFTEAQTTTVVFPQLHPGSRTHVAWRLTQTAPPLNGLNVWLQPPEESPSRHIAVTIDTPESMDFRTAVRGGFAQETILEGGRRIITAAIENTKGETPEPVSVDASDYAPLFLATSQTSPQEVGAIYARESAKRVAVTPEIAALAEKIAGQKTGLDAARAIYNWVAANIRYVAVYMDANDGWVPHAATAVLRAGYGDCKDHVAIMQALLAARGIESVPALVSYGDSYAKLPLWLPTQYNHAIIYLPQWHRFENPTDPFASFDATDRRMAGKQVVLATKTGALATIPGRTPAANAYEQQAELSLSENGAITGTAHLSFSPGIDSGARRIVAHALSPDELTERFLANTPEGGFGTYTASNPRDLDTPFSIDARWESPHAVPLHEGWGYAALPEGVNFEQISQLRGLLSPKTPPVHDFTAGALSFTWRTTLHLPTGLSVSHLPRDVDVKNPAGSYTAAYRAAGASIEVTRHLVIAKDVFRAKDYAAFDALVQAPLADAREVVGFVPAEQRSAAIGVGVKGE